MCLGAACTRAEAAVGGSLAIVDDRAWKNCNYTPSDHLPPGVRAMVEDGTIVRVEDSA